MKTLRILLAAAALILGVATPALADDSFGKQNQSGGRSNSHNSDWGHVDYENQDYAPGNSISSYRRAYANIGYDSDAQQRAAEISGRGPLKITLLWEGYNDLDLYVNDCNGNDIYWNNRTENGAQHTGDDLGNGGSNFESVSWSNPQSGLYDVFVRVSGSVPDRGLPVKVVIKNGGTTQTYAVRLPEGGGQYYMIERVDVEGSYNDGIPGTNASSNNTGDCSYSDVVGEFVRANTSSNHNYTLERRARNLSGSGRLRITLFWDFSGDCDLIVNTPGGTDLNYAHTSDSRTGAHHSGDQYGGSGSYESVYFTRPADGIYDVFVRARSVPAGGGVVTVVINDGSSDYTYSTRLYKDGSSFVDFRITGYSR